jgi:hypothetical protein
LVFRPAASNHVEDPVEAPVDAFTGKLTISTRVG